MKTAKMELPVLDVSNLTYDDFFSNFLMKNQACLIKNIAKNWESTLYWTDGGKPNFEYLRSKYHNLDVTIYDCKEKYYNSQKTNQYKFTKYVDYWMDYIKKEYDKEMPLLYLKDWHLKEQRKDDNFYEVPFIFSSDWLNEYLEENDLNDYRFVYMGPKGTWTPFHADVFTSYSWSANICGQKRWILLPPCEENSLRDEFNNLPYDISNEKLKGPYFEVVQEPGDAIFVPSGWHHQVWNTADTISINHNWINACNLKTMYKSIEYNLELVKKEISDCKAMDKFLGHCQVMLKASYGMDFKGFYDFVKYIAVKRLKICENGFDKHYLSKKYVVFDLESIEIVLKLFLEHEDVPKLDVFNNTLPPRELYNKIVKALNVIKK